MAAAQLSRVLAIDPALRNTGYAVLERSGTKTVALEYGTIRNRVDLLPSGCLVAIHEKVRDLIVRHLTNVALNFGQICGGHQLPFTTST